MLVMIAIRNLIELSGTEFDFTGGFFFPTSFGLFSGRNVMYIISYVLFPSSFLHSNSSPYTYRFTARLDSDGLGDARGLAQTRFYRQIQPHSTVCLRALHRRALS